MSHLAVTTRRSMPQGSRSLGELADEPGNEQPSQWLLSATAIQAKLFTALW
jgi:hypothetical protein